MTKTEYEDICIKRLGSRAFYKLNHARVAVAGLGGLGSHIAVMLARSCVGTLRIIDFDNVDVSNLNRQEYYLEHIGRAKTECLKEKLLSINPYLNVVADNVKITPDNLETLFANEKIVCEAFDSAVQKAMLVNGLLSAFPDIKLVSGSGMAGWADTNLIKTRKVFRNFYVCGDEQNEIKDNLPLMAARVSVCAGHQANKVIQLILEEGDEYDYDK